MSTKQVVAQTIVFDYEYDEQGVPLNNARVEVRLAPTPQPINQAPLVSLNPKIVSVQTDPNGYWQVSLAPNSGITPANTYYTVKVAQRTPYLMNVPAGGGPVQATSNLINQPSALSANVTNLTGPLTVAGLLTAQAGLTVAGGAVVSSGDLTIAARLVMTAAVSRLVPGATSFSLRNNADSADNFLLTDLGVGTLRGGLNTGGQVSVQSPALLGGGVAVAARYLGSWNTTGSPPGGPYAVGDFGTDASGFVWFCLTAGSPGTWRTAPAGMIAYAQVLADQAALSAITDLTGLTVTFTAVAGRRYRVTAKIEVTASAADGAYVLTLADGANTALQRATDGCLTTAARSVNLAYVEVPGAGVITRKLRLNKAGGTGTLTAPFGGGPAFILVEDIGT